MSPTPTTSPSLSNLTQTITPLFLLIWPNSTAWHGNPFTYSDLICLQAKDAPDQAHSNWAPMATATTTSMIRGSGTGGTWGTVGKATPSASLSANSSSSSNASGSGTGRADGAVRLWAVGSVVGIGIGALFWFVGFG
ncbi:hypothetical protein MMC20_004328 [Loxospora ochrophaea]|nr:hypothetical protein [Loxospora ochrophaea]